MQLSDVTPVILTRDEEVNIGRTLAALRWAREVLVVDSFSRDRTVEIAREYSNVRVLQRTFDSLAGQSNFGLGRVSTPWALLLDADYVLTNEFVDELAHLKPDAGTAAFIAPFRWAVHGRLLRGSLYPPRIVLLRCARAEVWQDGHAHRVRVDGETGVMRSAITHDDRKPFRRFLARQRIYMRQEAVKLRSTPWRELNAAGRIRKLRVVAPFAAALYTLVVKRTILDGGAGLRYTLERVIAEMILARELLRWRPEPLTPPAPSDPPSSTGPAQS